MESIWLSLKKKKGPKGRLNWLLAACIVFVLLAGGYTACQIRAKKAFGRNQEKKKCSDLIFFLGYNNNNSKKLCQIENACFYLENRLFTIYASLKR